jgi:signal transduction histidine kinase
VDEKKPIVVADFLSQLSQRVSDFFEPNRVFELLPKENFETCFFGMKWEIRRDAPILSDAESLKEKVGALISLLVSIMGPGTTEKYLENIYLRLEKKHTPLYANQLVLSLIPHGFLEKYRLSVLSKEDLQALVVEKTKANEELKELDKRKTEFISVVAHQLRTPLSGLKWGFDSMVKGGYGVLTDDQKAFTSKAYTEIEHMIRLVENMLSANKIEFNVYQLKFAPGDFVKTVEEAIDMNQGAARQKGVKIVFDKPVEALPSFSFDRERIIDIIDNLVDNAVRYAKENGEVRVAASFSNGAINCMIKDDGIGIPASEQKEIFTRFYRATNARSSDPNGNGLGLYIAKHLVEMHGGTLRFESAENQGTTFFITLPVKQ